MLSVKTLTVDLSTLLLMGKRTTTLPVGVLRVKKGLFLWHVIVRVELIMMLQITYHVNIVRKLFYAIRYGCIIANALPGSSSSRGT